MAPRARAYPLARGFLYITLHDEAAVHIACTSGEGAYGRLAACINRSGFARSLLAEEFVLGSGPYGTAMLSQVMMNSTYVVRITAPFLRLIDIVPRAYADFQTGYVFVPKDGTVSDGQGPSRRRRGPPATPYAS